MKTAVVLAVHGSTDPRAGRDLEFFLARAGNRFPGLEIRPAYTSSFVLAALKRRGLPAPSLDRVLHSLAEQGCDRAAVQTLHVVAGNDFREMARSLETKPPPFPISLGRPLLDSGADLERTAKALLAELPPERTPKEAVVLMGHGTKDPAGAAYVELDRILGRRDPHVFLGCLESEPSLGQIREKTKLLGLRQAWLQPFMALAGAHARRDLAGPGPESWASVLTQSGIECRPVLKGLCGLAGLAEIWLDHLAEALTRF